MSGLTPAEAEIMDAWDRGDDVLSISERLGTDPQAVRKIISTYRSTASSPADAAIRVGSQALLEALHRFHPETRRMVHP